MRLVEIAAAVYLVTYLFAPVEAWLTAHGWRARL